MIGYVATHKDDYNVGETYKVKGLPRVESEYGYVVYTSLTCYYNVWYGGRN